MKNKAIVILYQGRDLTTKEAQDLANIVANCAKYGISIVNLNEDEISATLAKRATNVVGCEESDYEVKQACVFVHHMFKDMLVKQNLPQFHVTLMEDLLRYKQGKTNDLLFKAAKIISENKVSNELKKTYYLSDNVISIIKTVYDIVK